MSDLADIQEKIQDTAAAISRLERALADQGTPPSVGLVLDSMRRRLQKLQDDFDREAARAGVDVCTYRIVFDQDRPTLTAITSAWADFQALVSVVYDALKYGRQSTAHLSGDAIANTSFGFGYTFPGSLGVVLTLPNERLLVGESHLDLTMKVVLAMTKAERSEELNLFASRLGLPAIRAVYKWAHDHVKAGLGATIEWRDDREVRASMLIQEPEIRHLRDTLNTIDATSEEEVTLEGIFLGGYADMRRFRFKPEGGQVIKGTFTDAISGEQRAEFPKRQKAVLRKRTRLRFSTDTEDVKWTLLRLESPDTATP